MFAVLDSQAGIDGNQALSTPQRFQGLEESAGRNEHRGKAFVPALNFVQLCPPFLNSLDATVEEGEPALLCPPYLIKPAESKTTICIHFI